MNLHSLAERQAEMHGRWAIKSRNPLTGKLTSDEIAAKVAAQQLSERAARGELACTVCNLRQATFVKRTGDVRPCGTCQHRLRRQFRDRLAKLEQDRKDEAAARREFWRELREEANRRGILSFGSSAAHCAPQSQ